MANVDWSRQQFKHDVPSVNDMLDIHRVNDPGLPLAPSLEAMKRVIASRSDGPYPITEATYSVMKITDFKAMWARMIDALPSRDEIKDIPQPFHNAFPPEETSEPG